MKKIFQSVLLLLVLPLASFMGCGPAGPGHSDGPFTDSSSYQYQFSYNRCDTGPHTFNSFEELCRGLQNSELNQHCASSMRQNEFVRLHCPGEFRNL